MTDIVLDDVASGFNLSVINDNFEVVKDVINDDLVHLEGGGNVMRQNLDMNSRRLLNLPSPSTPSEPARLSDLQAVISGGIDDASLINYTVAGTGSKEVTVKAALDEFVSVTRYDGVIGDGSNDDTIGIQAAIDANSHLYFPPGSFVITDKIQLKSDITIVFAGGASISYEGDNTTYGFDAISCENIRISGLRYVGTGLAGFSAFRFVSCTDVIIDTVDISMGGSHALQFESCSNVVVRDSKLYNNYYYGISDTDGINNRYYNNLCYANGSTGVATSSGGRGINFWRCVDCQAISNRFVANTEYGFRIYSEAADASTSYGNIVGDNFFYDNVSADIVLYDESQAGLLVYYNTLRNNRVVRTTVPTIGFSCVLHGGDNYVEDLHVRKEGTFGAFGAIQFYYAVGTRLVGGSVYNVRDCFAFSNATNCSVDKFIGTTVATASGTAGVIGSGCSISNSKFYHGGGGTTDDAIINYNATGKNYYENNYFEDFRRAIYIGSEEVFLSRNESVGSTGIGLRKDGNSMVGQEFLNNSWDSTTPWELSAIHKLVGTYNTATTRYISAPTTLTWSVGDRCYNTTPAAGQPKSWVCTVAGTPGTWVSEGNL